MADQEYLLALGGNLPSEAGPPAQTLLDALECFAGYGLHVTDISAFYDTPCFPAGAGPDYVNGAAKLRSALSPVRVLQTFLDIEARFGRMRQQRWGMRTLDLDLLAAGDLVLPDAAEQTRWRNLDPAQQQQVTPPDLILPHPRLQERAFVLVPLCDIAPDWVHPLTGRSVRQMHDALPEDARVSVRRRKGSCTGTRGNSSL